MAICPISLISQQNSVFYYQGIDCSNPMHTTVITSSRPLTLGCTNNPDCSGLSGGSPINPGAALVSLGAAPAPDDSPIVAPELMASGITAPLPSNAPFTIPGAEVDPGFAGPKGYFVVRVDGRDRYTRLVKAVWAPPTCLAFRRPRGKSFRHDPLPSLTLRIGQETVVPEGVKPRALTLVDRPSPEGRVILVKPRGAKDAADVFAVLLTA